MSTARKQVNVRLTDEENKMVEELAEKNRITKSKVVTLAINKELAKMSKEKNKVLSNEERKDVIVKLANIITEISNMKSDNAKLGNNINQIAKGINQGVVSENQYPVETYKEYKNKIGAGLEDIAEELDKLWHTLV